MDTGNLNFNFDAATGLVEVSLRAPLAIHAQTIKIPAHVILLFAAQITVKSIEAQQALLMDLAKKNPA